MTDPLVPICSIQCYSQTIKARELKLRENVRPTPCVMCHVSPVTCHLSRVTCHLSRVTCHLLHIFYIFIFFILQKNLQSVGASRWRVCYQRGLPRLVFFFIENPHLSLKKGPDYTAPSCPTVVLTTIFTPVERQGYRKFKTVQYNRI